MTIWHWNDSRLQSRQQVMENQDKNYNFWSMYDVAAGKHIALQDSSMKELSILPKQRYAMGMDNQAYELDINLDGQNYSDYFIVNLKTGERKTLFTKFYLPSYTSIPRPSTDGTKMIYGEDGHFYVYDIATGTSTNITENIPVTFVDVEDDHNVEKPMVGALGWSSDSKYVLLRDDWDIWQVPVDGKSGAINLTQNGRADKIRYQYRFTLDEEEKGIDFAKPVYIRTYGEWDKKSGIALLSPAKKGGLAPGVKSLVWEDANIGNLEKAENAAVFFFSKETFNTPPQMYVTDAALSAPTQITANAPDADKYLWSAGTRLVNYCFCRLAMSKGTSTQR
jgi:hypothetical protein